MWRREDFTISHDAGVVSPDYGDLHDGIDEAVWSIRPLLDWADRDERDRRPRRCSVSAELSRSRKASRRAFNRRRMNISELGR